MKPMPKPAILEFDRPPDEVFFRDIFMLNPKKIWVPEKVVVARWIEPDCELSLAVPISNRRYEERLAKVLMNAEPGTKLEIRRGALLKRLRS